MNPYRSRARQGCVVLGVLAGLAGSASAQCPAGWNFVNEIGPLGRSDGAIAFDAARSQTLLFGGFDTVNFVRLNDTWSYTSTGWTLLSPSNSPSARQQHAMAYDSGRQRVMLFGGQDGSDRNDMWEWDGTNWNLVNSGSGTAPSPRQAAAMAYDPSHSVTVLFGGRDGSGAAQGDTWEFAGATAAWTHRLPAAAPAARDGAAMVYDTVRQRIVLFGGMTDTVGIVGDTWEYNGSTPSWTPTSAGPDARTSAGMAFDVGRGRTVLFGGVGSVFFADTWERSGTAWEMVVTTNQPSPRSGPPMTYDSTRGRVVLFGGTGPGGGIRDTWEYVCGGTCYANCDGSTIPPILNVADFVCFQQLFAAGNPAANCDNSTIPPVLNVADFVCFQQHFAAGCP
jgi:hypothetical protein